MAGIGITAGLSAGVCSTLKAAQEEGFITAEQVDQVLNRATRDFREMADTEEQEGVVGSAAACDEILEKMHGAKSG